MNRKTDLTLEELIAEFEKPWPTYPRCLIINEIGEIRIAGGKEAKKAEEFLCSLLNSEDKDDKFYAFCWLSVIKDLDPQTSKKIEEFKKNPANKETIENAKPQIERYNNFCK